MYLMSDFSGSETVIAGEIEKKPAILWRAFTVDPRNLTPESLRLPLVPGTSKQDDPTRVADGNELGVYMSTNRTMVEAAYAHTSLGLRVEVPKSNYGVFVNDIITLPQCGIIVQVDTENLNIRKPKITPALRGHYNNGFEGDEYIADEVPPQNYVVTRLVLSRWANDNDREVVDIENPNDPEQVQLAIVKVQQEFQKREQTAQEFARFLNGLEPSQRYNEFNLKRKWQEHLNSIAPSQSAST